MLKLLKRGMMAALTILLFACSSVPPAGSVDNKDISSMRAALSARANDYQDGSRAWANKEWWNNGPLILLGTGSVAAASFASGAAKANWLVGLALAAGAWALTYSTLAPETKQDAYATAAAQFSCLSTQTASVDEKLPGNSSLKTNRDNLSFDVKTLNDQISNAMGMRTLIPAPLSDSEQLLVVAADTAIAHAQQTVADANAELQAAPAILPTLSGLYYSIDRKAQLAARGKVLTTADVSGALSKAVSGATAAPSGGGGGGGLAGTPVDKNKKVTPPSSVVTDYVKAAGSAGNAAKSIAQVPIVRDKTYTTALAAMKQCLTN